MRKLNGSLFTFRWNYSQSDEGQVKQFNIFRQNATGTFLVTTASPSSREVSLPLTLTLGTHKFFAAALGVNGMVSSSSNTVDVEVYEEVQQPPPPPTNFTVE